MQIETGDKVEIKEAKGGGRWVFNERFGHVTNVDKYCLEVRADDGELVRDVHDHFRPAEK